ncbi:hypothetical protein [Arthrobacter woluwensis]|uniref:hypothetical protein n=1 Tax=Arthrobacter woluwensis TaxID=156980 RepID=UPI0038205B64
MTWRADDNGYTLLHCFGCQAPQRELAEALGLTLADLFDQPKPFNPDPSKIQGWRKKRKPRLEPLPPRRALPAGVDLSRLNWEETVVYPYTDAEGTVVQEVVREEAHDEAGKRHKQIKQRFISPTGSVVKRKPAGYKPTLYRLPEILEAMGAGLPVWIVEGEKDADTAVSHGLAATTNAGGAGTFPLETCTTFAGADVVIVVDRDKAGYERGDQLGRVLGPLAKSILLLLPKTVEAKSDLTDHFDAGYDIEDFVQVSHAEMHLLALAAGVQTKADLVSDCEQEISAWVGSPDAAGSAEAIAKVVARWAAESHLRWAAAAEAAKEALQAAAPLPGERAREAEQTILKALGLAGDAVRLCHAAAGLKTPDDVQFPRISPSEAPTAETPGMSPATTTSAQEDPNVAELPSHGTPVPPVFMGNDFIPGDDGRPNRENLFVVRQGKTVQVTWVKRDGEMEPVYTTVIHGWAEVDQVLVADDGYEEESTRPDTRWVGNFYRWKPDLTSGKPGKYEKDEDGNPILESSPFSWGPEELKNNAWINHLPWPGLLESATSKGKDLATQAILRARPAPSQRTPIYTTTGWRESETGPFFVHAGGGLAKGGLIPLKTELPGPFSVFTFCEPCTERSELRETFERGIEPLLQLPPRIIAPLLGITWRSFMKSVRIVAHLAGPPGSGKTALARAMVHHAAPGLSYNGERREILSGSNKGGTALGLIRALEPIAHLPVWIDDFTADGDLKKAQQKLDEVIRAHYNATGRVVSSREGTVKASKPSKATVLTTSEFAPSGSAATRALVMTVNNGDIQEPKHVFADIERPERKEARNALASTLISWLALHRPRLLEAEEAAAADYTHPDNLNGYWSTRTESLPHTDGAKGRMVEAAAEAEAGVRLMMSMLTDLGAATPDEASKFIQWAREGIWASLQMQDSSSGDAGEQLISHLREALSSQAGHLVSATGSYPANPLGMGWTMRGSDESGGVYVPNGPRLGVVNGDKVQLLPNTCIKAARQIAAGADLVFSETATSISGAFLTHGWIQPDSQGARCVARRIHGVKTRVWEIPLDVLVGPEDDGQDTLPMPENPFAPGGGSPQTGPSGTPTPGTSTSGGMSPEPVAPAAVAQSTARLDANGVEGFTTPLERPKPCIMCSRPLDQLINGTAVCWADWHSSTEEDRAVYELAMERGEIPTPAPAQEPVLDAATESAQETTAPKTDAVVDAEAEDESEEAPGPSKAFDFAVAVLDAEGLWTPDGKLHVLDPWPRHAGDVAALAQQFNLGFRITSYRSGTVQKWKTTRGSIWLTAEACARLGLPIDELPTNSPSLLASELTKKTKNHPSLTDAVTEGWTIGGKSLAWTAWTRVYRGSEGAMLAVIPALDGNDSRAYPIVGDPVPSPATLAKRLERFATAIRHPLVMGSASTGMDLMFALQTKRKKEEYFAPSKRLERVYDGRLPEPEFSWSRKPTAEEAKHAFVHAYDRSGSYLAATKGAILPVGEPTYHAPGSRISFDPKTPGYWLIEYLDSDDWRMPNILYPIQGEKPKTLWVSTPTLALAMEEELEPNILEAFTWAGTRFLDGWADRLDLGLRALQSSPDADDQAARQQIKRVYTESIGMMNSGHLERRNGAGFAPERRDTIIGRAKANLLRRVLGIGKDTGIWPVAAGTDTIVYTSNEADPTKAWPGKPEQLGRTLGKYHHVGSAHLSDHLPFLTGHGYKKGLDHLKEHIGDVRTTAEESA